MYYKEQTKTILTDEIIANELYEENKKQAKGSAVTAVIFAFLGVLLFSFIYSVGLKGRDVATIWYIVFFACVFIWICVFVLLLVLALVSLRKPKNLCVITDTVLYKEEKTCTKRNGISYKKVVYFGRFGEHTINSTLYQLASPNDVYYMVVRDKNSKNFLKCYPAKLYEYQK